MILSVMLGGGSSQNIPVIIIVWIVVEGILAFFLVRHNFTVPYLSVPLFIFMMVAGTFVVATVNNSSPIEETMRVVLYFLVILVPVAEVILVPRKESK